MNEEIKKFIEQSRVFKYEIAKELGMQPSNFVTMLNTKELSQETEERIYAAIKKILNRE